MTYPDIIRTSLLLLTANTVPKRRRRGLDFTARCGLRRCNRAVGTREMPKTNVSISFSFHSSRFVSLCKGVSRKKNLSRKYFPYRNAHIKTMMTRRNVMSRMQTTFYRHSSLASRHLHVGRTLERLRSQRIASTNGNSLVLCNQRQFIACEIRQKIWSPLPISGFFSFRMACVRDPMCAPENLLPLCNLSSFGF